MNKKFYKGDIVKGLGFDYGVVEYEHNEEYINIQFPSCNYRLTLLNDGRLSKEANYPVIQLVKRNSQILNSFSKEIHEANVKAGWWNDLETGKPLDRNVGELLCLVHSEISEALEGYRKDLMDDKLPHRKAFEVEIADALIRIFDIAGKYEFDLDGAIEEKRAYNLKREDHKIENRKNLNGKKF